MKKVNVPSLVKTFTTLEWKKVKKKWRMINIQE